VASTLTTLQAAVEEVVMCCCGNSSLMHSIYIATSTHLRWCHWLR